MGTTKANSRRAGWWLALAALLWLNGCATRTATHPERRFAFGEDSFAYANELMWAYEFDEATGKTSFDRIEPPPTYAHRCFVMAKAARQFFEHAAFDPAASKAGPDTYRQLIQEVLGRDPAEHKSGGPVVIPGYRNLYQFSREQEALLKATCGAPWRSYLQRGHWRMVLPFWPGHQANTAEALKKQLDANRPPVLHLVRFPSLAINHAAVAIDYQTTDVGIEFSVYDPNNPQAAVPLFYDEEESRFRFPRNAYFKGGHVNVYEVYKSFCY